MFTLKAPAKINWFLFIRGKRHDGYHDIESLMQRISLYDTLTFEESDRIELITESPIPISKNLVYNAALMLKNLTSFRAGCRIILKKEIPISAGLGGGSADAAYTIMGLNKLWRLNLNKKKLSDMGLSLGSDIPFFLNAPLAVVRGRGEKIQPLNLKQSYTILLLKPDIEVSTKWAYSNVTELTKKHNNIKLLVQVFGTGDLSSFRSMARNDLENPVIKEYPVIGDIKQRLMDLGAVFSSMSGSGPSVFGVFTDLKKAESARAQIPAHWSRVVKTLT